MIVQSAKRGLAGIVIDGAHVGEEIELQRRIVAQKRADLDQTLGLDDNRRFAAKFDRAGDRIREVDC